MSLYEDLYLEKLAHVAQSLKHEKKDSVKKQIWVKKEKKDDEETKYVASKGDKIQEDVMMLEENKDAMLDLERCTLHELIATPSLELLLMRAIILHLIPTPLT